MRRILECQEVEFACDFMDRGARVLIGCVATESINIRFRTVVQSPSVPLVLGISERHFGIYEKCLCNGIHGLVAVDKWIARSWTLLLGLSCECFLRSSLPILVVLLSSLLHMCYT
jgi:hypothetical protein